VLKPIIVVLECLLGVERRIDVDAFNRAGELLFQRLKASRLSPKMRVVE